MARESPSSSARGATRGVRRGGRACVRGRWRRRGERHSRRRDELDERPLCRGHPAAAGLLARILAGGGRRREDCGRLVMTSVFLADTPDEAAEAAADRLTAVIAAA